MGIIGALFLGWFLGLFGFKGVVIAGMAQLFGVSITSLGYYFIFASLGVFHWIIRLFVKPVTIDLNDEYRKFKSKNNMR